MQRNQKITEIAQRIYQIDKVDSKADHVRVRAKKVYFILFYFFKERQEELKKEHEIRLAAERRSGGWRTVALCLQSCV